MHYAGHCAFLSRIAMKNALEIVWHVVSLIEKSFKHWHQDAVTRLAQMIVIKIERLQVFTAHTAAICT